MNALAMIAACARQNLNLEPPVLPVPREETLTLTGDAAVLFPSDAGRDDAYRTTQPSEVVPPSTQGDEAC